MTGAGAARGAAPRRRTMLIVAGVIAAGVLIAALSYRLKDGRRIAGTSTGERSIAVLPFENTSGDQEN